MLHFIGSPSAPLFKQESYSGCFHYTNKTTQEFFNNNGFFNWHVKSPFLPPSQGTPPMTLIKPFVELWTWKAFWRRKGLNARQDLAKAVTALVVTPHNPSCLVKKQTVNKQLRQFVWRYTPAFLGGIKSWLQFVWKMITHMKIIKFMWHLLEPKRFITFHLWITVI